MGAFSVASVGIIYGKYKSFKGALDAGYGNQELRALITVLR